MNRRIISALFIALGSLSACNKDFLNLAPNENISEDKVFGTVLQTQQFLNNIYGDLPNGFYHIAGDFDGFAALSDEGDPTFATALRTFNVGGYGPGNIKSYVSTWANSYKDVRKVNILLQNLDKVPVLPTDEQGAKTRIKGEALFLRAFYYFDILKTYGAFPIITEAFTAASDLNLPRNNYDECVAFIIKDLDDAVALLPLPSAQSANVYGRANKGMCMALKSRTLLYAASPLNNTGNDVAKWQRAADAAKAVIDLNQYHLYTANADVAENYKEIFSVYANPEIIMLNYSGNDNGLEQNYFPPGLGGWGCIVPTQNMVDLYQMANGKAITDPSSGYDPQKPYANREPRFYGTVLYNGAIVGGSYKLETFVGGADGIRGGNNNTNTGYYTAKWVDTHNANFLYDGSSRPNFWVWFRLAEMYLNYAEAKNEAVADPTADPLIYSYVNIIRARAGLPGLPAGLSKDAMRQAIRHERNIELAYEEHRFFDDRRWKLTFGGDMKAIEWNTAGTSYKITIFQNRIFDPKQWYLPIPQSEIDIDKQLSQNQGW